MHAKHARLDADRTAKPLTILTAPVLGGRRGCLDGATMWPGPAAWHVDVETGKRTSLSVDATAYMTVEISHTTSCKHAPGSCEKCGTTDRRDALHTTRGGHGAVAGLRKRR